MEASESQSLTLVNILQEIWRIFYTCTIPFGPENDHEIWKLFSRRASDVTLKDIRIQLSFLQYDIVRYSQLILMMKARGTDPNTYFTTRFEDIKEAVECESLNKNNKDYLIAMCDEDTMNQMGRRFLAHIKPACPSTSFDDDDSEDLPTDSVTQEHTETSVEDYSDDTFVANRPKYS